MNDSEFASKNKKMVSEEFFQDYERFFLMVKKNDKNNYKKNAEGRIDSGKCDGCKSSLLKDEIYLLPDERLLCESCTNKYLGIDDDTPSPPANESSHNDKEIIDYEKEINNYDKHVRELRLPVKLVQIHSSFAVCAQFDCTSCGSRIVVEIKDVGGTFTCRKCDKKVTMPTVSCYYWKTCSGVYEKCGGIIRHLSVEELNLAEEQAWKREAASSGEPTDGNQDWNRDIRGSIKTYECTKCKKGYSASQGVSGNFDKSTKCEVVTCNRCKRIPDVDGLPNSG